VRGVGVLRCGGLATVAMVSSQPDRDLAGPLPCSGVKTASRALRGDCGDGAGRGHLVRGGSYCLWCRVVVVVDGGVLQGLLGYGEFGG
jgi:hypothetical protein